MVDKVFLMLMYFARFHLSEWVQKQDLVRESRDGMICALRTLHGGNLKNTPIYTHDLQGTYLAFDVNLVTVIQHNYW